MALFLFLTVFFCVEGGGSSTLSNTLPRTDTAGKIIDAHDGNIVQDPTDTTLFYYFAAGYGDCEEPKGANGCASWCDNCGCGFFYNHSVNVYSTRDFIRWENHGNVLPLGFPRPNSVLFSPKALYNKKNKEYVLWYNLMPPYNYAVATSASPFGPFRTIANTTALSTQFGKKFNNSNCGDFSLFADDDGTAYILYSSDAHAQIERLTDDYYASTWATTGDTSGVFPHGNEAPAMFKHNGRYYALISDSCCYCGSGGQVRAFVAAAPLGPYTYTGDITKGDNPFNTGQVTTSSQQTNVFSVAGQAVWFGDRWQSAPEPTRFKAQDFTFWTVLGFLADGSVQNISWSESVFLPPPPRFSAVCQMSACRGLAWLIPLTTFFPHAHFPHYSPFCCNRR